MKTPLRVLHLEDDPKDAELIRATLEAAGFAPEIMVVQTKADYLAQLEHGWELVLADYKLPQFDGLRALALFKERGLDIVFILISGTIGEEAAVAAMHAGASDYIPKNGLARLGPAVERGLRETVERRARRQAEVKHAQLVAIVESAIDAIIGRDLDGTVTSWNAAAERMFGYTAAEAVGRDLTTTPPDRRHETVENRKLLRPGKPVLSYETVRVAKDGRRIDVSLSAFPIKDDSGNVIGWATILRDITERKHIEQDLQRFRHAMDSTSDAIYVIERASLRYIDVNAGACRMLGLTREEILAMGPEAVLGVSREELESIFDSVIAGGDATQSLEMLRPRRDGLQAWVELQRHAWRAKEGWMIVTVVRDISARKQAEAVRHELEAQLRESQKMEAIGTLAGGIAHDFNNIIAAILGNTDLARQDVAAGNPAALQSLDEILKAGRRARDLVQQILSFSRRQPTERKLIALAPIIDESVRLLRATLPARIALEVKCEAGVPNVLADATQIEQVIINLATNAMQAMRSDPGKIGIRLDVQKPDAATLARHAELRNLLQASSGRLVRISVSDSGPGMDEATRARIFEPFFTTKPPGEGTGLGLSVVLGIVQAHEGALLVASEPGMGATFTLYLPVPAASASASAASAAAAADADAQPGQSAAAPRQGSGRHILYIDDDEALVFLVKRLLERHGCRVSAFTDQSEALAALRADPASFDLVVTDYNMPGMSGLDVVREARSIRAGMPVAVASGFIDETLRANAQNAGVCELIFKASVVDDLCAAIIRLAGSLPKN